MNKNIHTLSGEKKPLGIFSLVVVIFSTKALYAHARTYARTIGTQENPKSLEKALHARTYTRPRARPYTLARTHVLGAGYTPPHKWGGCSVPLNNVKKLKKFPLARTYAHTYPRMYACPRMHARIHAREREAPTLLLAGGRTPLFSLNKKITKTPSNRKI